MTDPTVNAPANRSTVVVYEKTEVGQVREHNEDSKYSDPEGRFFIVADGMGGHAAGEVASQLAVEEVKAQLEEQRALLETVGSDPNALSRPVMTKLLKRVARDANTAVRKRTIEDPKTKGMGTTLEFVCMTGDGAWIGHVGDSRTYLIRSSSVTQLTTDQTVAQQLSDKKREKMSEVLEQWGSVLVEAIGAKDDVNADVVHCALESGDKLLLCSDGLYEYFPRAEEISEVLTMEGCEKGLDRLVELAYDRGGKDNITGVLIDVVEAPLGVQISPRADTEDGMEFDNTQEEIDPVVTPVVADSIVETGEDEDDGPPQDYGVAEAISLLRKLPKGNAELVVRVMKRTLLSRGVRTKPIIWDARKKQKRIKERVALLENAVTGLREEITNHEDRIATLQADRDETTLVKERLELAMKLDDKGGSS